MQRHPPDQLLLAPTPPALQKLLGEQVWARLCGGPTRRLGWGEVLASPVVPTLQADHTGVPRAQGHSCHVGRRGPRQLSEVEVLSPREHWAESGDIGGRHSGVLLHQVGGRETAQAPAVPWTAHGGHLPTVLHVGLSAWDGQATGEQGRVRVESLPPRGTRAGSVHLGRAVAFLQPSTDSACLLGKLAGRVTETSGLREHGRQWQEL